MYRYEGIHYCSPSYTSKSHCYALVPPHLCFLISNEFCYFQVQYSCTRNPLYHPLIKQQSQRPSPSIFSYRNPYFHSLPPEDCQSSIILYFYSTLAIPPVSLMKQHARAPKIIFSFLTNISGTIILLLYPCLLRFVNCEVETQVHGTPTVSIPLSSSSFLFHYLVRQQFLVCQRFSIILSLALAILHSTLQ